MAGKNGDRNTRKGDRISFIVARFFAKFDTVPFATLAERLDVNERTLQRMRDGNNEPSEDTLRRMLELIDAHDAEALATDEERLARAEQLRANHEKRQREIALSAYKDNREKRYPRWFDRVVANMNAYEYQQVIDTILDHLDDPLTSPSIPGEAVPYILHALGTAFYRTGRNLEAAQYSTDAITALNKSHPNDKPTQLEAWCIIIRGLAKMRMWRTKEAFADFEEAILVDREVDGGYYNALCCASLLKAEDLVGLWTGRYIEAADRFSLDDTNDVLDRIENDKDLDFFRNLPIFEDFKGRLLKIQSEKLKGSK